jgi:glycosyltransferase involved in cell wall biosynthesis
MRVLHIIGSLGMGGAETWLFGLLQHWRREGVDAPQFDFLATSGMPGIFDDEVRALGRRVFYLRYGRWNLIHFILNFRRILKQGNYTAIHDHQGWVSGWHFLMGAGLLPPIRVAHTHNAAFEICNLTAGRRVLAGIGRRLISRFATHIVSTSRQLMAEYGFDAPRFDNVFKAALYCGFDPARFCGDPAAAKASVCQEFGWPPNSKIILFAGRVDTFPDLDHPKNWKNSNFATSVGIECARRDPRIRMLFVGAQSPTVPILERRIKESGLSGQIKFANIRRDIERLMLASDVLLFPSRAEGLGMVAVEAQAAGLPVLASDTVPRECVIVPELVRFESLDSNAEKWGTALLKHASQPRNVEAANKRAVESAFSIQNSAVALTRLYRDGKLH